MQCTAFSATHRTPRSGKPKFISAGASLSGTSWKHETYAVYLLLLTRVHDTSWVGGIKVMLPLEVVLPMPASTCPRGPRSRAGANM